MTTKTVLYPAWFREWDSSKSGLCYKVYFYDFPDIASGQNKSFIDSVKVATEALRDAILQIDKLPTPSKPKHGDIMIAVEVSNDWYK